MSSQQTDGGGDRTEVAGVPKWLAIVSVIVLVAGLAVLGVFGTRYVDARSAQEVASERNTVTDVASQVIENAFSFDHTSVEQNLENLAGVSTGDFLAEQNQWAEDVKKRVLDQKAVTSATVSHTAVQSLDRDAGQASVLIVFTAHSEREGQDPITGRQAMKVDLVREDGAWKASAVNQVGVTVPVGSSSESVQDLEGLEPEEGSAGADTGAEPGADSESQSETDTENAEESTPESAPATPGGR